MRRIFKSNDEYFKWFDKYKDKYNMDISFKSDRTIKVIATKKGNK